MGVLHYVAAFVGVNTVAYSMYTVVTVNKTFGGECIFPSSLRAKENRD
jgi:hypothetical protein